jgi:hypothetical protein
LSKVHVLVKNVDQEPSQVLGVFEENAVSVDSLQFFFSSWDEDSEGVLDIPDSNHILELKQAHYTNMGWGSYSLEQFTVYSKGV